MVDRFPQEAVLRDGRRLMIRPFESKDVEELHRFFSRLPIDVRRFAWDNIDDRRLIESWSRSLDYSRALPLLAFDGKKVVADATLHRRDAGPLRRVGRVKWLIEPEYRQAGLGTVLVNRFISIGRKNGLRHLTCMLIAELEADAIHTLRELGFEDYVIEGYGTDPDGGQHDMVKLVLKL